MDSVYPTIPIVSSAGRPRSNKVVGDALPRSDKLGDAALLRSDKVGNAALR